MTQQDLTLEFDRLLSERLREIPGSFWRSVPAEVRQWIRLLSTGRRTEPGDGEASLLARFYILPTQIQEALRRFYIFGEAEESIGFSMNLKPGEFHRLRVDAHNFILGRRTRRRWSQSPAPAHHGQ